MHRPNCYPAHSMRSSSPNIYERSKGRAVGMSAMIWCHSVSGLPVTRPISQFRVAFSTSWEPLLLSPGRMACAGSC